LTNQILHPEENQYLNDLDDGLVMREAGSWAAEKLDYLCRYLNIFTTSMRLKNWRGLHFIDLFSGPGKCKIKKTQQILLGSPLLAIKLKHPFNKYFFVDFDHENIDSLKKRCETSKVAGNIEFFVGDSNQLVKKIVQQIDLIDRQYIIGKWPSMNLAFLDPEGFELKWETVSLLGSISRMDMIIYYPQMGLSREMPKDIANPVDTKIDLFFGGREWRDIYNNYKIGQSQNLHRKLMDLYEEKLKKLGYVEFNEYEPLMRNTDKNAPLYRLIFASKHPLGNEFWKQVTNRDIYGQLKLC